MTFHNIFSNCRKHWLAGLCPCCGFELEEWPDFRGYDMVQPQAVAEGVMFCGRCIGNKHHLTPGLLPRVLEVLVTG